MKYRATLLSEDGLRILDRKRGVDIEDLKEWARCRGRIWLVIENAARETLVVYWVVNTKAAEHRGEIKMMNGE